LVEDLPNALWTRSMFRPPGERQSSGSVAVDPPVTGGLKSDACGIVVVGKAGTEAVVLDDQTLKPAPPLDWAERAVRAFHAHGADLIVAEVNQGGDLVKSVIGQIDPDVPVKAVRPIAASGCGPSRPRFMRSGAWRTGC
jgi:phage terminase large subunit-like protein